MSDRHARRRRVAMRPGACAVLLAASALLLSGCIGTADETPPPPSPSAELPPRPAPPAPVDQQAPLDNCGLNPADMDQKTKAQCGLTPGEPSTAEDADGVPPGYGTAPPFEGDHSFETFCREGLLGTEHGCASAHTPEDDGPGSLYTNPESPLYEQYREETGYPYSEEQYEQLPGYQQCGTACGKDPTSGQLQHQYGCEQGYITEGC